MSAPAPLATVEQLSNWLGEPITDGRDEKRAELALRMASALVRKESGRNWLTDSGALLDPLPDDVTLVTLAAAGRSYSNPEVWESEGVDDWRGKRKIDEIGMSLSQSEKDLLARFAGAQFGGIGTIATTRGPVFDIDRETWVVNGPRTYLDEH